MLEYSSSYVLQLKQKLSPDACMSRCLASSLLLIELDRSGAKKEQEKGDNVEVIVAFSFLVAS